MGKDELFNACFLGKFCNVDAIRATVFNCAGSVSFDSNPQIMKLRRGTSQYRGDRCVVR